MILTGTAKVDVWFDVACPWCFFGKRRFESGAAGFRAACGTVRVNYHSFQLSLDPVVFDGSEVDWL